MAQLPQQAQGPVIAILVYTFVCLLCNLLMLWLLWTSRQTLSRMYYSSTISPPPPGRPPSLRFVALMARERGLVLVYISLVPSNS